MKGNSIGIDGNPRQSYDFYPYFPEILCSIFQTLFALPLPNWIATALVLSFSRFPLDFLTVLFNHYYRDQSSDHYYCMVRNQITTLLPHWISMLTESWRRWSCRILGIQIGSPKNFSTELARTWGPGPIHTTRLGGPLDKCGPSPAQPSTLPVQCRLKLGLVND